MITEEVIKEIYKKFNKPPKDAEELDIPYYLDVLKKNHNIRETRDEIIIDDLEEFNPFKRFLKRSIFAVLEFDKMVAFAFRNHILFLAKEDKGMRVHIRPEKPRGFFSRIFGRKRDY